VPRVLTAAEIRDLIEQIAGSAFHLKECGFSGVEISAGHGHLFHQFLSPWSNRRDDEYGGDWEGRVRIVADMVAALRAACERDYRSRPDLEVADSKGWLPRAIRPLLKQFWPIARGRPHSLSRVALGANCEGRRNRFGQGSSIMSAVVGEKPSGRVISSMIVVVIAGGLTIGFAMGVRQTFGLFLGPFSFDRGIPCCATIKVRILANQDEKVVAGLVLQGGL
jgi:hypothetical protein